VNAEKKSEHQLIPVESSSSSTGNASSGNAGTSASESSSPPPGCCSNYCTKENLIPACNEQNIYLSFYFYFSLNCRFVLC
jgi:hypothetical protein